jgi:ParB-like nuclease domain
MKGFVEDKLTLKGEEITVHVGSMPHLQLQFYLENPRLYSLVRADGNEPTQEDIEETLTKKEHVKHLIKSIQENGGLIDPIIVLGGSNVVIEGNSRLAAYRVLGGRDPLKWGLIKVKILPKDIDESLIFGLLGEYHIIGKSDWAPYEQAGYLYRRHINHKVSFQKLASEIGLSTKFVTHLVNVYQFMLDNDEKDVNRWSYYDEFLKSNKIKKAREEYPEIDELVVKKIKDGEIAKAVDVRDGIKKICEAGGKTLNRFVNGQTDFEESVQIAEHRGANDHMYLRLKKFRSWIAEDDAEEDLQELKGDARKRCIFELDKIKKRTDSLLNKLKNNN